MKEILESLDLSEDLKNELSESFDKALLVETLKIADAKQEEYEEYVQTQIQESKTELEDQLNAYLDRVIEEFITENELAIEESVNKEKFETLLEGFGAILTTAGVEISDITEAKADKVNKATEEVHESEESYNDKIDALVNEIEELKSVNAELLKTGLIKEASEDMSDLQKEKFTKLVQVIEFNEKKPEEFMTKLNTIAESITSDKAEKIQKVLEAQETQEAQEVLQESQEVKEPSWKKSSHLY
jgi:hypothetical protein